MTTQHRISVYVDEETYMLLRRYLPHGTKGRVIGLLAWRLARQLRDSTPDERAGLLGRFEAALVEIDQEGLGRALKKPSD